MAVSGSLVAMPYLVETDRAMRFCIVRPGDGEPAGWVAVVPDATMAVYVWVPSIGRFVYEEKLSGEYGYPMTEVVFETTTAEVAAGVIQEGPVGHRDSVAHAHLMRRLTAEGRVLSYADVFGRRAGHVIGWR